MSIDFTAGLSDKALTKSPVESRNEPTLTLGLPGFSYADLRDSAQYPRLTGVFDDFARERLTEAQWRDFEAYRASRGRDVSAELVSGVLVSVGPVLGEFIAMLFGVSTERDGHTRAAQAEHPVFEFKKEFVKKRTARRKLSELDGVGRDGRIELDTAARAVLSLAAGSVGHGERWNDEREVALTVLPLLKLEEKFRKASARGGVELDENDFAKAKSFVAALRASAEVTAVVGEVLPVGVQTEADGVKVYSAALEVIDRWCLLRRVDPAWDHHWVSLRLPHTLDPQNLVALKREKPGLPEEITGAHRRRERDGFALTDHRGDLRTVMNEVDYCIYCHDREKDSCSKGFHTKEGETKKNALGIELGGCPLDEKISEAHFLRREGEVLGALAAIMVDNPMLPGTGHRICNDCMKACIYQKQDPVNIPLIETSILTDVLGMRWGFEIYDFLNKWNPLRATCPSEKRYNGKNVLVVGMGPAGYTLAQWLLNEGFGVVGIDGLKLEALPEGLVDGPIEDIAAVSVELDERVLLGFGGVSEYGITVRWDKNFLTVLYLSLVRRKHFAVHGGVRFGGTIDLNDAWALGFHHVAIAAGAGRPTLIDIPNGLIRGIRQASDFLMALQLTGAFKKTSLASLGVRLPAVVVGGGLTAIDTATELRAYYIVQAEKVLERHETLVRELGEALALRAYEPEEREALEELLSHGRLIREERERAEREGRAPRFNAMLDAWGGVALVYRRTLVESPAYRLNHEEVEKCMEEGVRFIEKLSPREAVADGYGAVKAMRFDKMELMEGKLGKTGEVVELPARTVCIAAGTSPNATYEREFPGVFEMDAKTRAFRAFRAVAEGDQDVKLVADPRGFFTSYRGPGGQLVSFYGDNNPAYAGSVVRAMASAKDGHRAVVEVFERELSRFSNQGEEGQSERDAQWRTFSRVVSDGLCATVHEVKRLTPTIVEVVVRAPMAARKFHPGQFYRLQNFERLAPMVDGTRLVMEGLAMTGAWTDPEKGLVSVIGLEMGASSKLMASLRPGEPVVLMGPTGAPTEIPKGERVLLAGGGLGNAVLFSIGKALRSNGCEVLYFAGYRNPGDVFRRDDIEASADQVIWSSDKGPAIVPRRPQDRAFVGNIVDAMVAFSRGELGEKKVDPTVCTRLIVIGSDRMMSAVRRARHAILKPFLKPSHRAIASINSPMQCMMKEICAQCLQRHVDPDTGKASVVFTCFNQDQELDCVDFEFLDDRLKQTGLHEKLANLWVERLIKLGQIARV